MIIRRPTVLSVINVLNVLAFVVVLINAAEPTLELVHVLFRHGDRAPVESYPNDPYKDGATWPNGFGQLTKRGKRMQYALGTWLRKRYDGFINQTWKTEEVYVRSTDVDRTLMSAQCNMAAFYYPENAVRFNESLPWVPTPVHTVPVELDVLLNVDKSCPRVEKEKVVQDQLPSVKKVIEENQWLFKNLTEKSGKNISSILQVDYLYDTLHIEMLYNLTLDGWSTEILDKMKQLADFSFELVAYTKEMKRLRAGPLIKEMQEHMHQKAVGSLPDARMFVYSAHDTTVATLLQGLDVFNKIIPPYAATVLIELHRMSEEYYVKMFLRNDTHMVEEPHVLVLPGCESLCPLDDWIHLTSSVVPDDWDKECERTNSNHLFPQGYMAGLFVAATSGSLLMIMIISSLILWQRRRKDAFSYHAVPNNIT